MSRPPSCTRPACSCRTSTRASRQNWPRCSWRWTTCSRPGRAGPQPGTARAGVAIARLTATAETIAARISTATATISRATTRLKIIAAAPVAKAATVVVDRLPAFADDTGAIGRLGRAAKTAEAGLATESNLAAVTEHLKNIDALASHPPNAAMISRIQDAMAEGRELTPGEPNFMTHELTEASHMAHGVPQDLAHELAGQTHPLFRNYDPEVIKQFPEYFNSNWRKAWGPP